MAKSPARSIQISSKIYSIDKPAQVASMAILLKSHIVKHKLYTTIVGKNYAHVEGWQFAGGIMGLFPKIVGVENLSTSTELKWKAEVHIIERKTGSIVSTGFAICSNKESKKKSFDEYAVLSMAQTRAIGKAYRNLLGWVMKLAGYEGTPSEEMVKMGDLEKAQQEDQKISEEEFYKNAKPCAVANCGAPVGKAQADVSIKIFKKVLCQKHRPTK